MKVYYQSALNEIEVMKDSVLHTIPSKAFLKILKEKNDTNYDLLYNGNIIETDESQFACNVSSELIIRQNKEKAIYTVHPIASVLNYKNAEIYEQFAYEYQNKELDDISSIQLGELKLYAVDQSVETLDFSFIFKQLNEAFKTFRVICEKPKSHLKSINEVRPIETVKRIGYESIPYLAAHSEDWLARTASGLKPARLFSRVEDDDYQIYENRVVKTLIDLILIFLRRTEKQLRDQRDQLKGIINSSVQTRSFGFDVSFQKAIHELIQTDNKGDEYRSKRLEMVDKFQKQAYRLLKLYRTLRKSKLYRYLKKSKTVLKPLNATNILIMDKHYSVIYTLWKNIYNKISPNNVKEESKIDFAQTLKNYQRFCATLCAYAAHVIGFKFHNNDHYIRDIDNIGLDIKCRDDGIIKVTLRDLEPRDIVIPSDLEIPIKRGERYNRISYNGDSLSFPNDISLDEIEEFCNLFKTTDYKSRDKKLKREESHKYNNLKIFLDEKYRSFPKVLGSSFIIIPTAVELGTENISSYKNEMERLAKNYLLEHKDEQVIAALPLCNENEQKITVYAKERDQFISILPISMFDINSFRRLQNILYIQILKLKKETCPNCGSAMLKSNNRLICKNCNQLMLTHTQCPHPDCKHDYMYMSYDVPESTLKEMQSISKDSFFDLDSLYQYKNIVNMSVKTGRLRTICPYCHR